MHRDDGTYNIEFDDKDLFKEFKVPPSRIRKVIKEKRDEKRGSDRERGVEGVGGSKKMRESSQTDRQIHRQTDEQTKKRRERCPTNRQKQKGEESVHCTEPLPHPLSTSSNQKYDAIALSNLLSFTYDN